MVAETRRDATGRYLNPDPAPEARPGAREMWRWMARERPARVRAHRARGERLPAVLPDAALRLAGAREGLSVTWIGHSSLVLRANGRTFLLDPVWGERAGALGLGPKRLTPPGVLWRDLPRVDAVLLSHNHYDHLDVPTLRRLPRDTPVLAPLGVGALVRSLGFERVTERAWWESATVAGARATLVPAQHFSRRSLSDGDRTLWGGWVVEADGFKAYFAGDTGWMRRAFHDIGERFRGLDVALVPVGAYEPRWFMGPVHVDPDEAGEAFLATGARDLVPVHWGTFRLSDEGMDAPPERLLAWAAARGVDAARVRVPRGLGDTLDVGGRR